MKYFEDKTRPLKDNVLSFKGLKNLYVLKVHTAEICQLTVLKERMRIGRQEPNHN